MTSTTTTRRIRAEQAESFGDLCGRVATVAATKADYVVDSRIITVSSGAERGEILATFDVDGGIVTGTLTDRAHRQIGDRVAIPARYYDRMRTEAPDLLAKNLHHWFQAKPERRMLRTLDGRVRAFLSDRYRRLDNFDLLERAVIPTFQKYGDSLVFQTAAMTDDRLTVRALLPSVSREVAVGDVVQAGVEIRNSETGAGALTVAPFVWRLVCLNGMVASDRSLRAYHVGRKSEDEAYAIFRDDTLAADDVAFFLKVRDAIEAALDETLFDQIVATLRESTVTEPVANPVLATERLADRFSLTDQERGSVLMHLASGGDLSQWGVVNALTAAAKDADTFDRQREIEEAGGSLVGIPSTEWAALAAA